MSERIEFAAKCKAAMEVKGITLTSIAKELGISLGYVSDIVKGNRDGGEYKEKIAKILDVEVDSTNN